MHGTDYMTGLMLIGGNLVESRRGKWLESINPADETVIGRVPLGDADDMKAAVSAAGEAQPAWAALSVEKRVDFLMKLAGAILARAEDIGRIEALDTGNTITLARRDVTKSVNRMQFDANLVHQLKGETFPAPSGEIRMTVRVPYGVVGRIIPFNHPISFAVSSIAPVLVTGNTLVIKPPEQSSLSAAILAEICASVLPAGVINIVTGGREAGEALVRDPRVKRIAFTGSVPSGMAVQRGAADTAVKCVTLELGGKNPLIAFEDADVDKVAAAAVSGMNFEWQGQSCSSRSRTLLHDSIYDAVCERVLQLVRKIKVGNPLDPATKMGPINSKIQYEKVKGYIELGLAEGAELLFGGRVPPGEEFKRGFWLEPAVFGDVSMSMRLAREEIFGPVMSLMRFSTEEEAVRMANDIDLGLTAVIWTQDITRALRVAQRVAAGYIWVNGTGVRPQGLPYGGFKNSGVGREQGIGELLSYTEEKVIHLQSS